MDQNSYCVMAIDVFMKMQGHIPFDVYVKRADKTFTKVFQKGDMIDLKRFEIYVTKGVDSIFILKKDRRQYINSTDKMITKMLGVQKVKLADASFAVQELTEQILFEIYEDNVFDEETLNIAQRYTKSFVQLMRQDVSVLTAFLKMSHNETFMVRHSLSTAIFGLLLAKSDGISSDKMLEIICLGGLLHDIGMSTLSNDLNVYEKPLSRSEAVQVKAHTENGTKLIDKIPDFPEEVKLVIQQHHESFNGQGYPNGLFGDSIFYPARVINIADAFSALTTRHAGRQIYTPSQAMDLMIREKAKFDPKLLKKFEALFQPPRTPTKKTAA